MKKKIKLRHKWVAAWLQIFQGLIAVLTITLWSPDWAFDYLWKQVYKNDRQNLP